MEVVEVRDRLEALAREVRLISLGLFGIAYVHRNGDDTGPLIDFATQIEDKLLALALEIHPYEEKGLASEATGRESRSADKLPKTGETSAPVTPVRTAADLSQLSFQAQPSIPRPSLSVKIAAPTDTDASKQKAPMKRCAREA